MKKSPPFSLNGWVQRAVCSLLFVVFFYVYVQSLYPTWSNISVVPRWNSSMKSILIWNSPHRIETLSFGTGRQAFLRNKCSVHRCEIFTNRSALPFHQYDAVVMNMHEIRWSHLPESEGLRRSEHQRYVFLTQESPPTMKLEPSDYANYFNWTMSYRSDSDIPLLYGRVRRKQSAPKSDREIQRMIHQTHHSTKNYATNKTKLVAWMVSHCNTSSSRETYVEQLSAYVDVDVYGGCGSLNCPRNATHWLSEPQCYDLLASRYKFYLSFENSICSDYVTEKFFNILTKDLVPVVYGGANYSALAPAHSFIDALQFTPPQLAEHLSRLASNDTLYNEFFWWKDHYQVEAGVEQMARHAFCDLCRKLHQDSTVKVYDDLNPHWNSASSTCTEMPQSSYDEYNWLLK